MTVLCRQKTKKKKYKKLNSFWAFRLETAVWQTTEIWVARVFTFYRLTFKRLNDTKLQAITHAYVHRLADVHSAGFAPAFTLSFHDSECSRKPPVPIASVVMAYSKKGKRRTRLLKNLWRTVRFRLDFTTCRLDWICWFSGFCTADNSSQILKERIWFFNF